MASSYFPSTQAAMEYILFRLQRLEARLDELDRIEAWNLRWTAAHEPPRPDPFPFVTSHEVPPSWVLHQHPSTASDAVQPPLGFRQPSHAPRPSRAGLHELWESPWPRNAPESCSNRSNWGYSNPCAADPPPSLPDSIPCPSAEEATDTKMLGAAEKQSPHSVNATSDSGNGGGDADNAVQGTAAVTTLAFTAELVSCGVKAAKEGEDFALSVRLPPFFLIGNLALSTMDGPYCTKPKRRWISWILHQIKKVKAQGKNG